MSGFCSFYLEMGTPTRARCVSLWQNTFSKPYLHEKNPDYYKHFYSYQKHFYFASISLFFFLCYWITAAERDAGMLLSLPTHCCWTSGVSIPAQGCQACHQWPRDMHTLRKAPGPSKPKASAPGDSRRTAGSDVPALFFPGFPMHVWGDHLSCPTMSIDDQRWETGTKVSAGSQEEEQEPPAPSPCWTAAPASAGHQCSRAGAAGEALLAGDASLSRPWETQHLGAECCAAGMGPGLMSGETEETKAPFQVGTSSGRPWGEGGNMIAGPHLQSWAAVKQDTATAHRYGCHCTAAEWHLALQCDSTVHCGGCSGLLFLILPIVYLFAVVSLWRPCSQSHEMLHKSVTNFFSDWNTSRPPEWLS